MGFLFQLVFFLTIIPSAILHEYMHGWVADQLGDPTARYAGRLTLNPKVHIDPIMTVLVPLGLFVATGGQFLFAAAKPVPYNPYNLKDQKWGPAWVALAGPLSNFFLAIVFGVALQFVGAPLMQSLFGIVVYVNILLGVFNLVPIPPLDGSKILFAILPDAMVEWRVKLERYGMYFLLAFMFFGFGLIAPIISGLFSVFTGGFRLF